MMDVLQRIHWVARLSVAGVFLYHGLVPKILWLSPTELAMIEAQGLGQYAPQIAMAGGVAEIILGLLIALPLRSSLPLLAAGVALVGLLADVALFSPGLLVDAFNPVTVNLATLALVWIAWISKESHKNIP
ncbi:DoxX-like family protein [Hahella sp. HN01]|nr:DoxX-like family protein [Hahella sp. HN01]